MAYYVFVHINLYSKNGVNKEKHFLSECLAQIAHHKLNAFIGHKQTIAKTETALLSPAMIWHHRHVRRLIWVDPELEKLQDERKITQVPQDIASVLQSVLFLELPRYEIYLHTPTHPMNLQFW